MPVSSATREAVQDRLLAALEHPETAFSLAYRLGLDAEECRSRLEALVRAGAVLRSGGDEAAVYMRAAGRPRSTAA